MNAQAKMMAGLFLVLAIFASYFATYKYGRHVEFLVQDNAQKAERLKRDNEHIQQLTQYAKALTEKENQIAQVKNTLSVAIDRAERLHINHAVPEDATASAAARERTRLYVSGLDAAFRGIQEGCSGYVREFESLNIEAIKNHNELLGVMME